MKTYLLTILSVFLLFISISHASNSRDNVCSKVKSRYKTNFHSFAKNEPFNPQNKIGLKSASNITIPFPPGTPFIQKFSSAIIVDNIGRKWLGFKAGVVNYKNGTWSQFYNVANNSLPSNDVRCIHQAGNDIVVGTADGISIFNGSSWQIYNSSNTIMNPSEVVNSISSYYGKLYIGTNHGIFIKDGSVWSNLTPSNSQLIGSIVNSIDISPSGVVWVATSSGLSCINGTSFTNYSTSNGTLPNNSVKTIKIDLDNNVWISIESFGVYKLMTSSFVDSRDIYKPYKFELFTNYWLAKIPDGGIAFICDMGFVELGDGLTIYDNVEIGLFCYENDTLWNIDNATSYLQKINHEPKEILFDLNYLDTNNLFMGMASSGVLFWQDHNYILNEMPKNSGISALYSGNLWIGGKDANDSLHIVAEMYQTYGPEWSAGPIMDSVYYDSELVKWNKVWKVSKAEIDFHINNWWKANYVLPNSILNWPGDGDTSKGQMRHLAPYFDLNGNWFYDPQNGDYPLIRGDQALFFVFNDSRNEHNESLGEKLGVEVHAMAYEFYYPSDSALNNTMFLNYRIYNRSQNDYHDLYISSFTDIDVGSASDDKIGCDTTLSSIFGYNGDNFDASSTGEIYYGAYPPAVGVTFLNHQMGSFMPVRDMPTPFFPEASIDFYNYQKATWNDGTHLCYGGFGHPSYGSTNTACNFAFPGDLGDTSQWTDLNSNIASERRTLTNFGPFNFPAGESACFDLAYVFAREYEDTLFYASVDVLKQRIQQVRNFYDNNIIQNCLDYNTSIPEIQQFNNDYLKIYPNPSSHIVVLETGSDGEKQIVITDLSGRNIFSSTMKRKEIVDLTSLPAGIYIINVAFDGCNLSSKIVKQ